MAADEKIIAALISNNTVSAAAKELRMSKSTLYEKLKNPEFVKKYRESCRDLLKGHTAALQAHMGEAIATMVEIMSDKNNSPQTRVNAADNILRHGVKLTETVDILERLKELEGEDD